MHDASNRLLDFGAACLQRIATRPTRHGRGTRFGPPRGSTLEGSRAHVAPSRRRSRPRLPSPTPSRSAWLRWFLRFMSVRDEQPIVVPSGADRAAARSELLSTRQAHPDRRSHSSSTDPHGRVISAPCIQDFQAKSGKYDVLWTTWCGPRSSPTWLARAAGCVEGRRIRRAPGRRAVGDLRQQDLRRSAHDERGLLYYRSDLVPTPPTTWAELEADCKIAAANSLRCSAGQFDQYERLTVNAAGDQFRRRNLPERGRQEGHRRLAGGTCRPAAPGRHVQER